MFSHRITDHHELRLVQNADTDELFALIDGNRAYLRRWLGWLDSTTQPSHVRTFIESSLRQLAGNQGFAAAICLDGRIAGVIGYHPIEWKHRIGSFGYWLAECHQGHGIVTASCRAIVSHAFTTLGLNRLVLACATGNARSRAIPERLGFVQEGTLREAEWLYDHYVDHAVYALLRREWQKGDANGSMEGVETTP